MGDREELLKAVRARLDRVTSLGDLTPVLEGSALTQAEQLAATLPDHGIDEVDLQARNVLGWLYWYRYQALSAGQNRPDLTRAVANFTPCFVYGVQDQDLPAPLLPLLADQASPTAVTLLEQALGSTDPTLLQVAAELWKRILTATPTDYPNHAGRLNNLGIALRARFERTGAQADLDAAITATRQAVQATPADHPNHARGPEQPGGRALGPVRVHRGTG